MKWCRAAPRTSYHTRVSLDDRLQQWEAVPPPELDGDPIWKLPAYRIACFLCEISEEDEPVLQHSGVARWRIEQLMKAVESISANISEGYGRLHGRDRARSYEYALGSTREARDWYRRVKRHLGESAILERAALLNRIVRILAASIPRERAGESERRIARAYDAKKRARAGSDH